MLKQFQHDGGADPLLDALEKLWFAALQFRPARRSWQNAPSRLSRERRWKVERGELNAHAGWNKDIVI